MRFRLLVMSMVLMMAAVACDLAQPEPTLTPSRTPRPTITPTNTVAASDTPAATATLRRPTETETASATSTLGETTSAVITSTLSASATTRATVIPTVRATRPVVVVRPTIAPLEISNVLLIRIERDPLRENGAIVFLQVVYSGGKGPYRIFQDDTLLSDNPFQVLTVCDGTIVHTLIVDSADGQSVTQGYYFEHMYCPP